MSELPRGWEQVSFGDLLLDAQNGCGRRSGEGTPTVVLRLADVNTTGTVASQGLREIGLSEAERQKYALRTGDLLAFRVNGSRDITGRVIRYVGPEGYAYCDHFIRFRTDPARVDSSFAARAFSVSSIRQQVEHAMVSSAGQNTVSQGSLREVKLLLPPLDEQRRIVAKLETLQASSRRARAALDAVPPLLEKLRQSILAAAFRGDLTKDWRAKNRNVEPASELLKRIRIERRKKWEETELAKLKAKGKPPTDDRWKAKYKEPEPVDTEGLPELPERWAWASVDELIVGIEAGASPKAQGRPAEAGEFGVLKVSAVSWEHFDATENKALLPGQDVGDVPTVRAGDLLISRANTVQLVGAVVLVGANHPNLMLSDKTLRLVPSSAAILPEFLLYALRTREVRSVFEEDATGTSDSMRNLSQDKIRCAPIALAPCDEAAEVARRVGDAMSVRRRLLGHLEEAVKRGSHLDRATLARVFRGELVPSASESQPSR